MDDLAQWDRSSRIFRFKQFSLTDGSCAMKIGTDGVIAGAVAAEVALKSEPKYILDVGTGCGIMALMAAQKSSAVIHAIDAQAEAVADAWHNFKNSPWTERLETFYCSLQDFIAPSAVQYDLICCNPPYFKGSLQSPDKNRSMARHNHNLTFEELFYYGSRLLSPTGILLLIYPAENQMEMHLQSSLNQLHETDRMYISATPSHPPKRIVSQYTRMNAPAEVKESFLIIETGERNCYTEEYRSLTCDFHPFF